MTKILDDDTQAQIALAVDGAKALIRSFGPQVPPQAHAVWVQTQFDEIGRAQRHVIRCAVNPAFANGFPEVPQTSGGFAVEPADWR
jgi:hypothetical protein